MAHYSLLNNDDRGDIETFLAANVHCNVCHAEEVGALLDVFKKRAEAVVRHAPNCEGKHDKRNLDIIKTDWYYAFGSEGFNWTDDAEGPFDTEPAAKAAAAEKVADLPPVADDWIHQIGSSLRPPRHKCLPGMTCRHPERDYRRAQPVDSMSELEIARELLDDAYARLVRFELALRNAAYTLEFLADALPDGWRKELAVNKAADARATIRGAM